MAARTSYSYLDSLPDAMKETLGKIGQAPSAGNAWGAMVAPTLDPTKRPDVLNPDGSRSSLLSGSMGHPQGEVLAPAVTEDGRILDPDAADAAAMTSGKHLGVYSSPDMADQAAIAMHNQGAQQMQSPGYKPTMWTRADSPGKQYPSQAARDIGAEAPKGPQSATRSPLQLDGEAPTVASNPTPDTSKRTIDDPAFGAFLKQETAPKRERGALENIGNILGGIGGGLRGKSYDESNSKALDQKYEADQAKDPNSAYSQQLRQSHGPLLKQLGLKDEEIAHMSAADIQSMGGGGHLVEGLMQARQRSQQAQASQVAKVDDEKRKAAEWDRQNSITAPQRLEASQQQGAMQLSGQKEMAGVQNKLTTDREIKLQELRAKEHEDELRQKAELDAKSKEDKFISPEGLVRANPSLHIVDPQNATAAWQSGRGYTANQAKIDAAARAEGMMTELYAANDAMTKAREASDVMAFNTAKKKFAALSQEYGGVMGKITGHSSDAESKKYEELMPSWGSPHAFIESGLDGLGGMLKTNISRNLGSIGMDADVPQNREEAHAAEARLSKRDAQLTAPKQSAPKAGQPKRPAARASTKVVSVAGSNDDWEVQ